VSRPVRWGGGFASPASKRLSAGSSSCPLGLRARPTLSCASRTHRVLVKSGRQDGLRWPGRDRCAGHDCLIVCVVPCTAGTAGPDPQDG
jgi:hypothetical protein